MGVVVNLVERTVSFDGHVAHIDHVAAAVIYFGGDSVKDAAGYIDGKTGSMMATNMDEHKYSELYELVCPAATGALSGLHDIAAPDNSKVEKTRQRPSYAGGAAAKKKMKKSKSKT